MQTAFPLIYNLKGFFFSSQMKLFKNYLILIAQNNVPKSVICCALICIYLFMLFTELRILFMTLIKSYAGNCN